MENERRSIAEMVASGEVEHVWKIDPPQGSTSMGKCYIHLHERKFYNHLEDILPEGDPMRSKGQYETRRQTGITYDSYSTRVNDIIW